MNPFFSVIIPVFNRENEICNAIDSVLEQTFKDFELIVVDDGSTDKTPGIKEKYKSKIIYIRQENSGVSSARNSGIKRACGQYIALLDSDDTWQKTKLHDQYKYIKENPGVKIHQSEEIWIRNGKRVNPKNKHKKREGDIFNQSLELCLISPSAVVLHRSLFDKYGLFDEKMIVCEDYDLWLRISSNEFVGLLDKPLINKYGGHSDQLSRSMWGMDRFRVYSMLKLYNRRNNLNETHFEALCDEIIKKSKILKQGAINRNNLKFVKILNEIIQLVETRNYNNIDYLELLQE